MHTEASRQAHYTGQAAKTSDQRKILEALEVGPKTLSQLAAIIGKPNSTVSARLDLLQRIGYVAFNDYITAYELVPRGYENATGREYRRRMTIARAKTLLNDLEFLPPYLIDACNRFLMDNGEKPRIKADPDKFTEPKVQTSLPHGGFEIEGNTISFLKPPDKFTGV